MAKAAGLTARHIRDCGFREVMAEHAVQLLIAMAAKDKVIRVKQERPTMSTADRKNLELEQQRRRRNATRQAKREARTARIDYLVALSESIAALEAKRKRFAA